MLLIDGGGGRDEAHRPVPADAAMLTAAVSLMAGLVHAAMAPEHFEESALFGAFFVTVAALQWAWAVAVYRGAPRPWLRAGAVLNLAVIGVWLLSRTTGLPLGPEAWTPEGIGIPDVLASVDEAFLAVVALAVLGTARPARRLVPLVIPVAVALSVLSLAALMVTQHQHG